MTGRTVRLAAPLLLALAASAPAAAPEAVHLRLVELCTASRLVLPEAAADPAQAEPALAAVRLLLEESPGEPGLAECLGKPRLERVLQVLDASVAYLEARGLLLQAAGGSGFYTFGSLLGEPEGWNTLEQGLPALVAPALIEAVPVEDLLRFLRAAPDAGQTRRRVASVLSLLGAALAERPGSAGSVLPYVAALCRLQSATVPQDAGLRASLAQDLVNQLLLDPPLLLERPELAPAVAGGLGEFLAALPDAALRDEMLLEFNQGPVGGDFRLSEAVESAAGVLVRASLAAPPGDGPFRPEPDPSGRILASVYSLPSHFFRPEDCRPFLQALLRELPVDRKLLVLADFRLRQALGLDGRIVFLETYGRYYSPWPRDPFLFVSGGDPGGTALLFRPPLETRRQDDSFLAHEIYRKLPEPLRQSLRLGGLVASGTRFHAGQLLFGKRRLYHSVHALEEETLVRQHNGALPAANRAEPDGAQRYLENAQIVAQELGAAWGLEPVFVHPFPPQAGVELLRAGAGRDLDSYMTVLEDGSGADVPVVGSLALGRQLATALDAADAAALAQGLRLRRLSLAELRSALLAYEQEPQVQAFGAYLDLVAGHMRQRAGRCERLPLLFFPVSLLDDGPQIQHADFLVGWTNLVAERRSAGPGTARTVELFSQSIPSGDRQAQTLYESLGYRCLFLPPLRNSIVFGGGYRCASNHLRAGLETTAQPQPRGT